MASPLVRDAACAALGFVAAAPLGGVASRMSGRATPWGAMAAGCGLACMVVGIAAPPPSLVAGLALALTLALLAAVDISALRLPDALTLPLMVAGLGWAVLSGQAVGPRLVGAALGFAVLWALAWSFRRTTGRAGLGMGDAKLFAAAGAWLGWDNLPQVLLIACGLGFLWVGVRSLTAGLQALRRPIPFGAPLCVAILAEWLLRGAGGG